MIALIHTLIGVSIAIWARNPWFAFFGALASHFILDIMPHWDYMPRDGSKRSKKHFWFVAIDCFFGLIIVLILAVLKPEQAINLFFGAAGAVLPDILQFSYIFLKLRWLGFFSVFHHTIHDIFNHPNKHFSFKKALKTNFLLIMIFLLTLIKFWG